MKILVVSALPSELKVLKEWIKSAKLKENLIIDYLCCWIWNYETISSLEHYLSLNAESIFIWNIWVCGYRNQNNEKKFDPIQVASVINLHTEKEMIIPPFLQVAPLKTCFSSENIIFELPKFQNEIWIEKGEMYFDMESWWIEFVCLKYKCPCLILKVPFDFIWDDVLNNWKFSINIEKVSESLSKLSYHEYLLQILGWIQEIVKVYFLVCWCMKKLFIFLSLFIVVFVVVLILFIRNKGTDANVDIMDSGFDYDIDVCDDYFMLLECIIENSTDAAYTKQMRIDLKNEIKVVQDKWRVFDEDELAKKCNEEFESFRNKLINNNVETFGCLN